MSYSVFKALEHYGRNATRDFSCYLIHGEEKLKKIFLVIDNNHVVCDASESDRP